MTSCQTSNTFDVTVPGSGSLPSDRQSNHRIRFLGSLRRTECTRGRSFVDEAREGADHQLLTVSSRDLGDRLTAIDEHHYNHAPAP